MQARELLLWRHYLQKENNKMIIKPSKERLHKERGEWEGVFKSYYPEVDTEEII